MVGTYQFEEYMSSAREALHDGNTDTAMDWVNQALSLSKHLDEEAIAQAHQLKAQVLVAQEEYAEAEEALLKSLDLFGRNAEGHFLLGELALLDGRIEEATSAFESATELSPESAHALSMLIFCRAQFGKQEAAREAFEKCVGRDPGLADAHYHMGICLLRERRPEARELFEKALSLNPVLSGPHYYLGRIAMADGDLAGAERQFQREMELNPANSLAEFQLIRSYLVGAPWQEAVDLFDKHFPSEDFCDIPALKSCRFHFNYELLDGKFEPFIEAIERELPQTPENLFHEAKVYRLKSLFGEAIEVLKKIIESESHFRPAYLELSELYGEQDEFRRASGVLEQAAEVFQDAEAYCSLSRAYISEGRYTEAEEAARKAVPLRPDLAETHYLLGAILTETASRGADPEERMREAKQALRTALEIDPSHTHAKSYLMHIAFQGKDYSECIQIAEKMLSENPEDRMALWYSGRCLQAMGEMARAEERLAKLVETHPEDQSGRGALAEVYRAQGKFQEAAEELEQAVAVPGRRPLPDLLFLLGEIYLQDLKQPAKSREYFLRFLHAAPPGHPNSERAKRLLGGAVVSED